MVVIPVAQEVWRKYNTDGVPASGPHQPEKTQIMLWGSWLESLVGAGVPLAYALRTTLDADLAHAASSTAIVYADPVAANNGFYVKAGASGAGSWSRIGDLPNSIVRLMVTGGTGDAIVATAPETPSVPGNKLYLMTPTANCTGASTLALNGGAAVAIKTALGDDTVPGSLVSGSQVLMAWAVDHYQLLISAPVDASGILVSAIAARDAAAVSAVSAAASASGAAASFPRVVSRQATPPGAPANGDHYVVVATATGAWAGHEGQEAVWNGSAWVFTTPTNDDLRWVNAEDDLYYSSAGVYRPYLYSKNILYPEQFGAFGTDGTVEVDDSLALRAFFAAGAGKELVLKPGRTYWWKDGPTGAEHMYVQNNCRIIGWGATLKALTTADINTTGLMACDATWVGNGPTRFTIEGLRLHGNRAARIAAGSHPNSVGQAAMIYCIGTQRARILHNELEDLTGDGIYMGGHTTTGRLSAYFTIESNTVQDAGRNGLSYVGTLFGETIGNRSFAHSFGVGHGNISYAYDIEPDGVASSNTDLVFSANHGGDSQVGFGLNNNSFNSYITFSACRSYGNTVGGAPATPTGFFAAPTLDPSVKLTGCSDRGSTTAFSGCASAGF